MRKSRHTEHPHMNFRRLAASDGMTPAFLPGVSQIKQPCGEHAALCSDARRWPIPRGNPPKRDPFRRSTRFEPAQVRKGRHGYRRPTSVGFKFGLGAKMSPA